MTARTRIAHFAVRVPERALSTDEILAGCATPLDFPFERWTGIRERPMAAPDEGSLELLIAAAEACIERSGIDRRTIDTVIVTSISRMFPACELGETDAAPREVPFRHALEPGAASEVVARLGLRPHRWFDLSNACAATFTALATADAWLRRGAARRVLIASGELLTPAIATAQRELSGHRDLQVPSLTFGDAGAALLVDHEGDETEGLVALEMYTRSAFARACIGRPSDRATGGPALLTDAVRMAEGGQLPSARQALLTLDSAGWVPEDVDWIVPHQTSRTTLRDALRTLDHIAGRPITSSDRVIDVLSKRGNTATTSHWVALADGLSAGQIQDGQRVVFGINGSGLTIGTALYELGGLPSRAAAPTAYVDKLQKKPVAKVPSAAKAQSVSESANPFDLAHRTLPRARIAGAVHHDFVGSTIETAASAARALLALPGMPPRTAIDVLIYTGVYNDSFIVEPAIATMVAERLGLQSEAMPDSPSRTFAFDVIDGGVSGLVALDVAAAWISSGRARRVLLISTEIDPPVPVGAAPRGIEPGGGALLLEAGGDEGFTAIVSAEVASNPTLRTLLRHEGARAVVEVNAPDTFAGDRLAMSIEAARRCLEIEAVDPRSVALLLAPSLDPERARALASACNIAPSAVRPVGQPGRDLLGNSVAAAWSTLREPPAGPCLLVASGAGTRASALLYFPPGERCLS